MIAVLGAGISGLTVAHGLKQKGKDFIVLEAENEVGGKIKSLDKDGFILELGPNTVLRNNEEMERLLQELDLIKAIAYPNETALKNRYVLYHGKPALLPSSFRAIFGNPLISFNTIVSVLAEPFKKKSKSTEEESLAAFSRRRFGSAIYRNFIYPFVTGIYAGDPERMSMDFTLNILKQAEQKKGSILLGMPSILKERKKNRSIELPKQKIFTFKKGLQTLPIAIAQSLGDKVQLNCKVESIEKSETGYLIRSANKTFEVEKIISTLPAKQLANIVNWNQSIKSTLKELPYVPAFVHHFAFRKEALQVPKNAFGLLSRKEENTPFLGILFNHHFFPQHSKKDCILLTIICGGYQHKNYLDLNPDEVKKILMESLKELFALKEDPLLHHQHTWEQGIPQFELGHQKILDQCQGFTENEKNFWILGNFTNGVSVSDCVKMAKEFIKDF